MNFKDNEVLHIQNLILTTQIFNGDPGNGKFGDKSYPYHLQTASNNLYDPCRSQICDYIDKNGIGWWNGSLPNNPLSSQVACLNHLFPIRNDKKAVLALVKEICPEIVDVIKIETDEKSMQAYIQFEAITDTDHLNEKRSTRGSNCTSLDALIVGKHKDGRTILFPIEWKYVEAYGNTDKASGAPGVTRKMRYDELIKHSKQLKQSVPDIYYHEPFYQLMRQTLWAEQMIEFKNDETIKADNFIHIHVVPSENKQLLDKTYKVSGKNMEESWRDHLIDQSKYRLITPKVLMAPVNDKKYFDLIDYLRMRYW